MRMYHNSNKCLIKASNNLDKYPYLSNYYYDPRVNLHQDILIPLYLTDYDQKEYLYDINSETFTIEYALNDGKKNILRNIPAGDYVLNCGSSSVEGENIISIQIIDKNGLRSSRIFKSILVVNPDTYIITDSETYNVTEEDLMKYGIKINSEKDEDCTSTRLGFTTLLQEIKKNGYRKAVIPQHIYRINCTHDRSQPIFIPDRFTLDLNGATIKQQPSENNVTLMMSIRDCFDSHVTNGIIEGDYDERAVNGTLNGWSSEGMNCLKIAENSRFCSFNNLTVKKITGYANATAGGGHKKGRIIIKNHCPKFTKNTQIDINTGNEIKSVGKSTSSFLPLNDILIDGNRYISMFNYSFMGGIMGCNDFTLWYSFYDNDYNFLDCIQTRMYQKIIAPLNSKYLKLTVCHEEYSPDIMYQLVDMPLPTCCSYNNIHSIETRTCAFNPNQCNDLDMSNLTFTRCACDTWGSNPTPVPIDIEDGWFLTNDFYFRNLEILEKSSNSSAGVIIRSGSNIIFDNCKNLGVVKIGTGAYGSIVKECKGNMNIQIDNKSKIFGAYTRVYNNALTSGGGISMNSIDGNYRVAKDCTMLDCTASKVTLKNCTLNYTIPKPPNLDLTILYTNSVFDNCILNNIPSYSCRTSGLKIKNSEITNCIFDVFDYLEISNTKITNMDIRTIDEGGSVILSNCPHVIDLYFYHQTHVSPNYTTFISNCNIILNKKELIYGRNNNRNISIENCKITITPTNVNLIRTQSNIAFANEIYNFKNSIFNMNGGNLISGNFTLNSDKPTIINNVNNIINGGVLIDESCKNNPNIVIN